MLCDGHTTLMKRKEKEAYYVMEGTGRCVMEGGDDAHV